MKPTLASTPQPLLNKVDGESRILLPTKVYPYNLEVFAEEVDDDGDLGLAASLAFQAYPRSMVKWTAQPVVKWIESLAVATENAELEDEIMPVPMAVEGIKLSQCAKNSHMAYRPETHTSVYSMEPNSTNPITEASRNPQYFDASILLKHDRYAWSYVHRMHFLANEIELLLPITQEPQTDYNRGINDFDSTANKERFREFYHTIWPSFEFSLDRIVSQIRYIQVDDHITQEAELRLLLDTLCNTTIRKLQRLLETIYAENYRSNTSVCHTIIPSDPVTPMNSQSSIEFQSPSVSPIKKDLGSFMTNWLLNNWTNPYPDDDGLTQLAHECGVTSTVVSNWLINARTRKWRPAIVKATNLNHRPCFMLLEDSIAIFQGRPLRTTGLLSGSSKKETEQVQTYPFSSSLSSSSSSSSSSSLSSSSPFLFSRRRTKRIRMTEERIEDERILDDKNT